MKSLFFECEFVWWDSLLCRPQHLEELIVKRRSSTFVLVNGGIEKELSFLKLCIWRTVVDSKKTEAVQNIVHWSLFRGKQENFSSICGPFCYLWYWGEAKLIHGRELTTAYVNLYISDIPESISRKFRFTDVLAMAIQTQLPIEEEDLLSYDIETMQVSDFV